MPKLRTLARKYGAKLSVATAAATCSALALAADPTSPQEALTGLSTSNTGYGPILWGLAAAATGIMIGVMWIKRGKRAA